MIRSPNTVIIGFRKPLSAVEIGTLLGQVKGFVRVVRVYSLTPTALVEVEPPRFDTFIEGALKFGSVEYCNYNYLVAPYGYHERVHVSYRHSTLSSDDVRSIHQLSGGHTAGAGITIALVDSGLAPHLYLPSTSFFEAQELLGGHNYHYANHKELLYIVSEEKAFPSPLSANASSTVQLKFLQNARDGILRLSEELIQDWFGDLDYMYQWMTNYYYQMRGKYSSHAYSIPFYWSPLEFLHRISLRSYNFLDDNLNIEDHLGHGTQMAGILCGISPYRSYYFDHWWYYNRRHYNWGTDPLAIDVLGVVPRTELMVLKCYDAKDIQASTVDTIIRALEHAEKENVDLVYIGLGFRPEKMPLQAAMALDRTISALAKRNIPVVCPAGNDGLQVLSMPAGAIDAIAVSAIDIQKDLAPYSNSAGRREQVMFSAFGGTEENAVITTNVNFGFSKVHGTSVAAAIVTGILAKALSTKYITIADDYVANFIDSSYGNNNPPSTKSIIVPKNRISIADLLSSAKNMTDKSILNNQNTSTTFGYGVAQEFTI